MGEEARAQSGSDDTPGPLKLEGSRTGAAWVRTSFTTHPRASSTPRGSGRGEEEAVGRAVEARAPSQQSARSNQDGRGRGGGPTAALLLAVLFLLLHPLVNVGIEGRSARRALESLTSAHSISFRTQLPPSIARSITSILLGHLAVWQKRRGQ